MIKTLIILLAGIAALLLFNKIYSRTREALKSKQRWRILLALDLLITLVFFSGILLFFYFENPIEEFVIKMVIYGVIWIWIVITIIRDNVRKK